MFRVITVELDSAAEAALDALTVPGIGPGDAIRNALVAAAQDTANSPVLRETNSLEDDDVVGLA